MPNMDNTGPQGKGPKTGRQMGNCNQNSQGQNLPIGQGRRQLFPWRRKLQNQAESMEEYYKFLQDEIKRVEKELDK